MQDPKLVNISINGSYSVYNTFNLILELELHINQRNTLFFRLIKEYIKLVIFFNTTLFNRKMNTTFLIIFITLTD